MFTSKLPPLSNTANAPQLSGTITVRVDTSSIGSVNCGSVFPLIANSDIPGIIHPLTLVSHRFRETSARLQSAWLCWVVLSSNIYDILLLHRPSGTCTGVTYVRWQPASRWSRTPMRLLAARQKSPRSQQPVILLTPNLKCIIYTWPQPHKYKKSRLSNETIRTLPVTISSFWSPLTPLSHPSFY